MAGEAEREELLLTAAELARVAGVSDSTIWNWTERPIQPLRTVRTRDGAVRFTWTHLEEFCQANPGLRGVIKFRRNATRHEPAASAAAPDSRQVEDLKSLARDLRNAANANLQAALEAARHAEETARTHRRQLEAFAASMAAYDAALSQLTAPASLHD